MLIKVSVSVGFGSRSDELDLPDNLTEDEIEEYVMEWANNYIDIGWSKND